MYPLPHILNYLEMTSQPAKKELKEKADLAESLGKSTEKPTYSNRYRRNQNQSKPYSRPTHSSTKPNWPQRRQQQDTRPQMRGQ